LSDGELFYIIQSGMRLSGMQAGGPGSSHDEQDSWKLVQFIRHLPELTAAEEQEMERLESEDTRRTEGRPSRRQPEKPSKLVLTRR
jgi:hypothetical protein